MAETLSLGQKGETFAAAYLQQEGYKIRHRNWVSGKKEMDIVAENEEFVVFIEVKTRTDDFLDDPRKTITKEKQQSMIYLANNYIHKYQISKESRFDVIIVIARGSTLAIDEHIEQAFYPTLR